MPTLLQINCDLNWGSIGKIAEQISNTVISKGWKSYIAYGRDMTSSNALSIKVGTRFNVYEHYAENLFFDNEGLASRFSTIKLINEIEKIKPNIIQLHNIHDHWLNYKILFSYLNKKNIRVIWTFHDYWAITGHCYHFAQDGCEKFWNVCEDCPVSKKNFFPLFKKTRSNYELKKKLFLANHNLIIVAVSDWVKDNVKRSFLKEKRIEVIHNGVDTTIFKPTQLENKYAALLLNKFVIMAISSQWKSGEKGLNDYIAMSRLLKNDEIIVLVGLSEGELYRLPNDNIVGIRRTNNQKELASLYTRADVVCSFSTAETFGLTIVEGLACGTPAVVYDNTAPPALLTPQTGYVVPNNDYVSAYNAIQEIKRKGKKNYSEYCLSIVQERYDKDICCNKYLKLYEQLL